MHELQLPAVRVLQGGGRHVYSFGVDGKQLARFAAVSRLRSGGLEDVIGYQRPEVVRHIAEIRRYLEGESAILPNSIVVAFDPSVTFTPSQGCEDDCSFAPGTLTIRWDPKAEAKDRPAWIVDGQQRLAAIRDARVGSFNVCATAFITEDDATQREQFLLLNNTRPLPKSLIYELLPGTAGILPSSLARKRTPALLTRHLNHEEDSPFHRRIRLATNPKGYIRDNSVMRMIEHSLSDGALFRIRLQTEDDHLCLREMLDLLKMFWTAVAATWPDAWGLPPRRSRLLHGAGLASLGFVMDEMIERPRDGETLTPEIARSELEQLREVCFWTSGVWPFGEGRERLWNELQNIGRDISLLSNYLLRQYRVRVRDAFCASEA